MRFFTALAVLPALFTSIIASPVAAGADVSAVTADVPGVQRLTRVSKQLTALVKEIKDFKDGDIQNAQLMINHAAQTLRTLNDAVVEIEQGPDIDLWTATSYAKIAIPLTGQVHDLSDSLKSRKVTISALGLDNAVFQMLDAAYSEVSRLMRVYTKKVPQFIRPILKPWLSDLTETIGDAKEQFRGDGGSQAPPLGGESAPLFDGPPAAYTSTVIVYAPAPTGVPAPGPQWQIPSFQFANPSNNAQRPAWETVYEASKTGTFRPAYSPAGYVAPAPTA